MTQTTAQEANIVEHEGYLIDADTGEIVGMVEQKAEFHVTDLASAEWVLEKMDAAECEASALETRLAAVQERMQTMIREKRKRMEWLKMRFGPELEQFAAQQLDGAKTKTLKTPWGNLAFRKVAGRLAVKEGVEVVWDRTQPGDPPALVQWAIAEAPDALKKTDTLAFQISRLPKDMGAELPNSLFVQVEPREVFDIKVGAR